MGRPSLLLGIKPDDRQAAQHGCTRRRFAALARRVSAPVEPDEEKS